MSSLYPKNSLVLNEDLDDNNEDDGQEDEKGLVDLDELAISNPVEYEKIMHGDLNA
jgi:hypothetical protein